MSDPDHDTGAGPPPSSDRRGKEVAPRAWRVTFEYVGDSIFVVAQQRVAMVSPPDDAELLERGRAGYWVEVRDANGRTLYRQIVSRPIREDYEVFSPEPGAIPQRVPAQEIRGVFQVVVPDLESAHEVVLFGRPKAEELQRRDARQLLKVRLREKPYGGSGR